MALFVLSDTHFSESSSKPMDIFGNRWQNYTAKLTERWNACVGENDTVIVPGDISWGMSLKEAEADLKLLSSLKGQKIIAKGNHDYWWASGAKMQSFFDDCGIDNIAILHCNAYPIEGRMICGTRGWYNDEGASPKDVDYAKIVNRECIRLEMSLEAANKIDAGMEKLVFMHFPPVFNDYICRELVDMLHKYGVRRCFYGHIHGSYNMPPSRLFEEIEFTIVSADYLNFIPKLI